jgi:hypothetical protein
MGIGAIYRRRVKFVLGLLPALVLTVSSLPEYYTFDARTDAETEARHRVLPLVWLVAFPQDLNKEVAPSLTRAYLTQMALRSLQNRAVVILADAGNLGALPDLVNQQVRTNEEDDLLKDPRRILFPKLIFTNPEASRSLGRVSLHQLVRERDVEINAELVAIGNDSKALAPPTESEKAAAAAPPPDASTPPPAASDADASASSTENTVLYVAGGVCLVLIVGVWMRASARRDTTFRP